ncbi:30S ribosomal protein S10e [Blastomyces gilchristii SLH14081]|uniref:30S ribosomal protein S10e n=1 Tax=Blastomyces gilchristii (strain SLH14081) TaxID=559298 RepID=A0A179U6Y9_BLAGS|nr:30S ribosomal protein S10e [Blastomyces gilchristii SLH14081]OAT03590.1 30S ribosomal protein S10e [Blastomyces gilchristii SLH14081]
MPCREGQTLVTLSAHTYRPKKEKHRRQKRCNTPVQQPAIPPLRPHHRPNTPLSKRFPELRQELATMLIPKADRKKIHEYIFREGVLVAKKDFNLPKHGDIDTKNLYVIKACQSLTSRGYLKTRFSWQYYYYTLTPEGLDYLREWLHLPAEIVPATHIKQQRSHAPPRGMMGGEERERRPGGRGGPRGDGGYRRREQGEGKEGGAPGDFAPSFRGGFGRGRGAPAPSS